MKALQQALTPAVLALLLSLPAGVLAWLYRDMPNFGIVMHDDSVYFATAQSIARTGDYRIPSLPVDLPQTKYPPVLPVLLSGIWWLNPHFPSNLQAAMLVAWVPLPLCLWLLALHARDSGFSMVETAAALSITALSSTTLFLSTTVLSEVWFTALMLAATLLAERTRSGVASGLAAAAMVMTRLAGLSILATSAIVMALRKRWRAAAVTGGLILFALAIWAAWTTRHPRPADPFFAYYTSGGYSRILSVSWGASDAADLFAFNAVALVMAVGDILIVDLTATMPGRFVTPVLLAASISGAFRLARETGRLHLPLFSLGQAALLVAWIYPPTTRLIWPLLPILSLGLIREIRQFVASGPGTLAVKCTVAILALLWLQSAWTAATVWYPGVALSSRIYRERAKPAHEFITTTVPPNEGLVAYSDVVLYLETGRRAIRPWLDPVGPVRGNMQPGIQTIADPVPFMRANQIHWLFVTPIDYHMELLPHQRDEVLKRVRALPSFETVYDRDGFQLLHLKKGTN